MKVQVGDQSYNVGGSKIRNVVYIVILVILVASGLYSVGADEVAALLHNPAAPIDMTIFGADGLLVDVRDGVDWNLVDQLGSGGALDSLLFVSDWAEHRYDLDFLDPGATSQLRFRFVSDDVDTDG